MATDAATIFRRLLTKPGYYFLALALTAFFWFSFDKGFGTIFSFFIIASFIYYVMPKGSIFKRNIDINTVSGNTPKAFGTALLALAVFLVISFFVVQFLQGSAFAGLQGVMDRISQTTLGATGKPILAGNPFAIFVVGAVFIPIIETEFFFVTMPQFFSSIFNIQLNLTSTEAWVLMLVIAGIFTYYHIEAKSITDNVAWILTFIFGVFQSWLVLKFREGESAIHMHIQNNALGILQRFLRPAVGM